MAIAYHTHTFEIPTATDAETQAGVITDKVVIPAGLAAALASYVTSTALTTTLADYALSASLGTAAAADVGYFATAAQGAMADSALQSADIGSTVQAYDADLAAIAALAKTDGNIIVGDGTSWTVESGSTARSSLGLGTVAVKNTGTSGDAVPLLNVAHTWDNVQTFSTTAAGTAPVRVVSSEAGAGQGPFVDIARTSASPAASDALGGVRFRGMDSGGNETLYTQFRSRIIDPTDGSEDGALEFVVAVGGVNTQGASLANGFLVGAATGSYQGTGTVNATGYYVNGVALSAIFASLAAVNVYTKAQTVTPVALIDAATVALDLSLSNDFTLTLGGNRTLGNPTNRTVGQWFSITVTQDGTGSRTLAYDTHYKFPGAAAPVLTTTANAYDTLTFRVKSATEVQLVGIAKAFG